MHKRLFEEVDSWQSLQKAQNLYLTVRLIVAIAAVAYVVWQLSIILPESNRQREQLRMKRLGIESPAAQTAPS